MYEPRQHLLRQKREQERKQQERSERERAEWHQQQSETERSLVEEQQVEALRKHKTKEYSMIKLRWNAKKAASSKDGQSSDIEKEPSAASVSDSNAVQQKQSQLYRSSTKATRAIVDMRKRALPLEPE